MRILVTREALMRQIDEQSGAGGNLPPHIYVDGVEMLADGEVDACIQDATDAKKVLTWTEWRIFRELLRCAGTVVDVKTFAPLFSSRGDFKSAWELRNNLSCHIVHIRHKIEAAELPYRIITLRGFGYRLQNLHARHETLKGQN